MNSHFDAQTAISQIKHYGTILLFSQKNNNLHPALELSPLMEIMTVCQTANMRGVRRTRGLTHRLEYGFNIIFQYNPPLLQCIWPTFLLSSLCL